MRKLIPTRVSKATLVATVAVLVLSGCVLNPVDNPTLAGTTWELTSGPGGLSPGLLVDFIPLNSTVTVEFTSGSGSVVAESRNDTQELGFFSYTLREDALTVSDGTSLIQELDYVVDQNDSRMHWNTWGLTYYRFKFVE